MTETRPLITVIDYPVGGFDRALDFWRGSAEDNTPKAAAAITLDLVRTLDYDPARAASVGLAALSYVRYEAAYQPQGGANG